MILAHLRTRYHPDKNGQDRFCPVIRVFAHFGLRKEGLCTMEVG